MEVSEGAVQVIEDSIDEQVARSLSQVGADTTQRMKAAAQKLISVYKQCQSDIIKMQDDAKTLKKYRENILNNLKEETGSKPQWRSAIKDGSILIAYNKQKERIQYKQNSEYNFDKLYKASLQFNQEIFNLVQNRKVEITLVFPGDENNDPSVYAVPIEKLFEENSGISIYNDLTSTQKLEGRFKINQKKIQESLKDYLIKDNIIQNNYRNLIQAYQVTGQDYDEFHPYVFWKNSDQTNWHQLRIGGARGDIAEAYAYFFLGGYGSREATEALFSGQIFSRNMSHFIEQGVAKVDNVSGLYEADIMTDKIGYAVKSLSASLPGIHQMIELAYDIQNSKISNVEELKEKSKQVSDKARSGKIRNKLSEVTQAQVQQAIDSASRDNKGNLNMLIDVFGR